MTPIHILLADDHPVYRDGLRLMLETDPEIKVVGEPSGRGNGLRGHGFRPRQWTAEA